MVKIQVLGEGLIPRGHGIAPKLTPFEADLKIINVILQTGGLQAKILNPETGAFIPLTSANAATLYKRYDGKSAKKKETTPQSGPVIATPKVEATVERKEEPKQEEKKEEQKAEEKVEEKKEDNSNSNNNNNSFKNDKHNKGKNDTFKPVNNPNEN